MMTRSRRHSGGSGRSASGGYSRHHKQRAYSNGRRGAPRAVTGVRRDSRGGMAALRRDSRERSRRVNGRRAGGHSRLSSTDQRTGRGHEERHARGSRSRSAKRRWSPRKHKPSPAPRQWNHDKVETTGYPYGASRQMHDSPSSESSSDSRNSSVVDDDNDNDSKNSKDEIIHFKWEKGMLLNGKYMLEKGLGDGTFGRVLLAADRRENRQVAIKVIRDVKRYMENAKIEADLLKDVRKADPNGSSRCAIMYDTFTHEGKFFCLVFEPLGVSIYDFLKKNSFRGFWMQDIQAFAKQCLKAVKFLHKELSMTHTDLKPENILLQSMEPARPAYFPREAEWEAKHASSSKKRGQYMRPVNNLIKIIDFGNATYEEEHHSSIINTRQYRGPEVVLELGWDERSDIWSLGCIFMEMYTGELLFETHENLEHLALMEKILGPLPGPMLASAPSSVKTKFMVADPRSNTWRLNWPGSASAQSERHVRHAGTLEERVSRKYRSLVECVGSMLVADPRRRPSASEVLKHPFFSMTFDD